MNDCPSKRQRGQAGGRRRRLCVSDPSFPDYVSQLTQEQEQERSREIEHLLATFGIPV